MKNLLVFLLLLLLGLLVVSEVHHVQRGRHIVLQNHVVRTNHESALFFSSEYAAHRSIFPDETLFEYYISLVDATPTSRKAMEKALGRQLSVYVPHNTFVLYGSHEEAALLQNLEEVHWVGLRSPAHKIAPGLESVQNESKERELLVSLNPDHANTLEGTIQISADLCDHLLLGGVKAQCTASSPEFILVECELSDELQLAAKVVSSFPPTHFVEKKPVVMPQNDIARQVIEDRTDPSTNPDGSLLTGLFTGEGMVIGLVDSGIDWDNCFFNDPNVEMTFNERMTNHRKFTLYDTQYGNSKDDFFHGTHMAGTMVGHVPDSVPFNSSMWGAEKNLYQGIVPDAKIAFVDINDGTSSYNVPTDMTSMFDKVRNAGAFVSAHGWGVASTFYGNLDVLTDRYTYQNQDFLPLFAIGNQEYRIQPLEPLSPATAKSSVAVGSSFSSYRSFTRKDGQTGFEYANLHRYWYDQLCGAADSWYFFSPFCTGMGWQYPCNNLKDDFCQGLDGFVPFGPAGNATRCCEYRFLDPICCQATVEANIADNPGLMFTSLALDGGSIRGPIEYDGRFGVDVVGPGQYIVSAKSDQDTSSMNCGDDAFIVYNGTSMSTAVIASAALKIQEYFLQGYYPTGQPTENPMFPSNRLVKAMLMQSGDFMAVVNLNSRQHFEDLIDMPIPNNYFGYGRVQLDRVLKVPGSNFHNLIYDAVALQNVSSLSSRAVWGYRRCIKLGNGVSNVKITLTWSDPPVVAGAGIALRNNLDLSVLTDLQVVYKSNALTSFDAINPVEQISFTPLTQTFTVLVRGTKMVDSPETVPFSLLITAYGGTASDVTGSECIGVCPHRCSFRGFCNLQGHCECESGYEGVDCSLSVCPLDCSGNGVCDGLLGVCRCGEFWVGDACNVPLPEGSAEVIVVPGNCSESNLVEVGVVIAVAFGAFFGGFLIGAMAGFIFGLRYLVNRKKKQVGKLRQKMAARDQGGASPSSP